RARRRCGRGRPRPWSLSGCLHHDGGAVAEDFGDALGDFGGVVAHADDRVGADGGSVLAHDVEGFLASVLAELGVNGNVAADERLQAGADVADDAAGADGDAAHDSQVAGDTTAFEAERGGDPGLVHGLSSYCQGSSSTLPQAPVSWSSHAS